MPKKKLLWQLYLPYLLVSILALSAIAVYAANSFKGIFLKQTASELEAIARVAGIQIAEKIHDGDNRPIDAFCKKTGTLINGRLTVILPSGAVIGDSGEEIAQMDNHANRPEVISALKDGIGIATRSSLTLKKEMMYVAIPVMEGGEIAGVVRASMPVKAVTGITHPMFVRIMLEGIFIAALVAAMIFLISRRVIKPLDEIRLGAEKFRRGDLSYRMRIKGSDEVKALAETMNQMAGEIKERIERQKKLEDLSREFAANVSHELKTPIASIQGFAETLNDGALDDPEKAKPFLGIIAAHAKRISHVIEDLLSLSRIEEDESKVQMDIQSVREALEAAAATCKNKADENNIRIELNCGDEIRACINAALIEQAVLNLIDNAIKHSEKGGRVVVEGKLSGNNVQISVKDFGCGISPEHLDKIFERFYRVDKGRSRKQGGTGLGLAIAKHIAEIHRGNIRVESKPGSGSAFTIELPTENLKCSPK